MIIIKFWIIGIILIDLFVLQLSAIIFVLWF